MKTFNKYFKILSCIMLFAGIFGSSCKDEEDVRAYEGVNVVGVKINNKLYIPKVKDKIATIDEFTPGTDLSALQIQILVANGELIDIENNRIYDCRKPLLVKIKSFNGGTEDWKLKFISTPTLSNFSIEGVSVEKSNIFLGPKTLTVGVPKTTDLKNLKVSMSFINGTLIDFTNAVALDYTDKRTFSVKGVDEETIYTYDFRITTEKVGPATILGVNINGVDADSVRTNGSYITQIYLPALLNLASADIKFTCGIANEVDPNFVSTNLNLLSGTTKVKIKGTDGIEKEFTLACPKIATQPMFSKSAEDLYFGEEAPQALGISGNNLLIANYQSNSVTEAPVGVNYYDFTGKRLGSLSYKGTNIDTGAKLGVRKMTTDDSGNILCVQLGAGAAVNEELTIYKWKTPSSTAEKLLTYSGESLGLAYGARAAGINVTGSVDGDAIIVIPMAKKKDVAVFTIKGGVVQPKPKVYQIPYTCAYYYSVQPMPIGIDGYLGALNGVEIKGLVMMNNTMNENFKFTGFSASDCKVLKHKDRIYLAYTVYAEGKGGIFRICDITDGQQNSFENPLFEHLMSSKGATANETMDAEMAVINGKLHAAFLCTNIGVELYCLEK